MNELAATGIQLKGYHTFKVCIKWCRISWCTLPHMRETHTGIVALLCFQRLCGTALFFGSMFSTWELQWVRTECPVEQSRWPVSVIFCWHFYSLTFFLADFRSVPRVVPVSSLGDTHGAQGMPKVLTLFFADMSWTIYNLCGIRFGHRANLFRPMLCLECCIREHTKLCLCFLLDVDYWCGRRIWICT